MTKERMERLMEMYQGIGVETENGQCYFYEAFDLDLEGAIKRVHNTFSGLKFGNYKVFIAQSQEVERMINLHEEEVVIYETKNGDAIAVLENQAIRLFENVGCAVDKLHKAGFIYL